jgi:parallel beta-helix repeat protein
VPGGAFPAARREGGFWLAALGSGWVIRIDGSVRRLRVVVLRLLGSMLVAFALVAVGRPASAAVTTLYVDRSNPACSDKGSGTQAAPYCTINAGAQAAVAGQTVLVNTGTYPESVTVKNSGTASAPIVISAAPGASVVVNGGGTLTHGFTLSGKSYVTIQGFTVTSTTGDGIYLSNGSHDTIAYNRATLAGRPVKGSIKAGIHLSGTTNSLITHNTCDHDTVAGIYLTSSANGNTIVQNLTTNNAAGYQRLAPGIDVRTASNVVANNVSHDNEDTGLQFYTGASSNLVYGNVSYNNGDHGIDDLNAPNQVIIGNSIYKNVTAGINLEGSSTGGTVENNVSVDNGINSPRTSSNIRIDAQSIVGATMNFDLVFLHQKSVQLIWGKTSYSTLAAFQAATGQEANGIEADPLWNSPTTGDFTLRAGSPAIDAANAAIGGEPTTDILGNPRVDDPATPNTGVGPRTYDDRGAYEFQPGGPPPEAPPTAALSVSPSSGAAPLSVTADASGSTDADTTPIATYTFDFGDGTVVGPQAGATATHTYAAAGTYTVSVTATDTAGLTSTPATAGVTVTTSVNLVGNPDFETGLTGWNTSGSDSGATLTRVADAHSGSWAAHLANTAGVNATCTLNDSPNWVAKTVAGTYTATMWVKASTGGQTLKLRFREYNGSTLVGTGTTTLALTTAWQPVTLTYVPSAPGASTLDLNAYVSKAPSGFSFNVDDVSVTV